MRKLIAVQLGLTGLALGGYAAFLVLINGVQDIADGAKANPTDAKQIVWGILQVTPLTEGVFAVIVLCFMALALWLWRDGYSYPSSRGGVFNQEPPGPQIVRKSDHWPGDV